MNNAEGRVDRLLAEVFANGRGEAGLEVGTDPGLSDNEYIRVPRCLIKKWVARTKDGQTPKANATLDAIAALPGWVSSGDLIVHNSHLYIPGSSPLADRAVDSFRCDRPTYDDIRRFVAANITHIRDADLPAGADRWVHAVRFWSVVSGFVHSPKSPEWILVDDPKDNLEDTNEVATFIAGFAGNAWTAVAARATSWRKSNHATGGDVVTGFPRRWLQKMSYWVNPNDKAAREREQKALTTAFYVATHASAVHPVLALMAGSDINHWASVNPCFGLIVDWDVRESTVIRMLPNTQVAGTAWVVDAMVCLKMITKEGIAPLLDSFDMYTELVKQYKIVENFGIRVASYAGWFLDGHPLDIKKVAFNQKDSASADLIGELGAVATKYYAKSTIGESPALANAMSQASTDTIETKWTQLAKAKKQMSGRAIIQAYGRIKGASASSRLVPLISQNRAESDPAVAEYNSMLQNIAKDIGVMGVPSIEADAVAANAASADRQAEAFNALAQAMEE